MSSLQASRRHVQNLTISALLIAFGIAIPMFMPIKLIIGPASYTLASHVPLFIALFISPAVAVAVALGTTLGFFFAGFPFVIVVRALTQLVFVLIGAYWLQKSPKLLDNAKLTFGFAVGINLIHALFEFLAVLVLTNAGALSASYVGVLVGLIGLGTLVHGTIDFYLALYCWRFLKRIGSL
ncbi:hypothetical protein ACVRZS_06140 [Streptococcus ferus]|uniref:Membrane protein n=1 Tax=Streptococcus ferus TaxID=1345 RepID=A0A2X3WB28_9STRE|nr:hypothetical protein [Streptococcus ferus]SQF41123.1 membrane protein [Streptococcus ferus]